MNFLLNRPFGFRLLFVIVGLTLTIGLSWADDQNQPRPDQIENQQIIELQTLIQLADDNIRQAQYEQALISLTRAYELSQTLEDDDLSNTVLNSIAHVYFNTGQFEQAHRYYSDLVSVDKVSGDQESLAVSLFNLGHVNASMKNHLEAEANFQQSLVITRDLDDKSGTAFTLKAMGVNAQAQLNFDSARVYLIEALRDFETVNDEKQIAAVHRHLADIAQTKGQFKTAVRHYETALPILAGDTFSLALLRTYRGLSTAYEQLQYYEQAFISQRAYTQLLQQQLEQQNRETTQRLQVQFETQQFSDSNKRLALLNQSQRQELQHRQQLLQLQYIVIGLAIGVLILVAILWWRSRLHARHMEQLATIDELTGLLNRRAILEYGNHELQRAKRFDRPLCCLLFDIDHFKNINDTLGHAAGDKVLITLSAAVNASLRKTDAFGRFGGEEFLLIATETNTQHAEILAERIRHKIEMTIHEGVTERTVTVSIGIASTQDGATLEEIIAHADKALYQAKDQGRNQVVSYQAELES